MHKYGYLCSCLFIGHRQWGKPAARLGQCYMKEYGPAPSVHARAVGLSSAITINLTAHNVYYVKLDVIPLNHQMVEPTTSTASRPPRLTMCIYFSASVPDPVRHAASCRPLCGEPIQSSNRTNGV